MRSHPVGDGLDQCRATAFSGPRQRRAGDRDDGKYVVAVDPHTRNPETPPAFGDGHTRLQRDRFGDRPLVVLAEEDNGGMETRGESEGFGDVALAGGPVTEVRDRGTVHAVELHTERIAGGVQRLRAHDDRRCGHPVLIGVPARMGGSSPEPEHVGRVHVTAVGDRVLAVTGEDEVLGIERPRRADLRGLLTEQRRPQAELSLALQSGCLGVDAPHHHQVLVEAQQRVHVDVGDEVGVLGVLESLARRADQLDQIVVVDHRGLHSPGLTWAFAHGSFGARQATSERHTAQEL